MKAWSRPAHRFVRGLRAMAALAVAACSPAEPAPDALHVTIRTETGAVPESYRVVLARSDSTVLAQSCPSATSDDSIGCTAGGVVLRAVEAGAELTVKARGHGFVTHPLSAEALRAGTLRVELPELAPFETNAHYSTGISEEAGIDAFLELAASETTELGPVHSVKFYIADLRGSPRLYLQNTQNHPLHYDFARLVLGVAASREQFAQQTYRGENRSALAGTLIYRPELRFETASVGAELRGAVTLEFLLIDDLSPALALTAHRLLEERLGFLRLEGAEQRLVYLPATSSREQALAAEIERFRAREALFAANAELYAGVEQQILNPGIAYGTLRRLTPEELATTLVSFRDLVVLPSLPDDLPLVGGTITDDLQTPLAHVNLAARARGTPNLALRGASTDPRIEPLLGELVRFEVNENGFSLAETTLEEAEAFWESRAREPLVPDADTEFDGLPGFESLGFEDSLRVGVKAANLAELRGLLGEDAPEGFAVPFSAYHAYMTENRVTEALCAEARADCEEEGRAASLCDAALERCDASAADGASFYDFVDRFLDDSELAVDTALREACLDTVRYLVKHGAIDPEFAARLDGRVEELFGTAQVRLRSSTNAEDLPGFSGAGLYESVSAEIGGRLPSSRIRDVWASVWLFRAFEERAFWNIDSRAVRMAVAVNRAIDDEAANGVLITQNLLDPDVPGYYVNVQLGEIEVANPAGGAVPEIFAIVPGLPGTTEIVRERFSSLSPDTPLLTDAEIGALHATAERVQSHFAPLYERSPADLALDIEFKLYGPERRLLVKQVRPYSVSAW